MKEKYKVLSVWWIAMGTLFSGSFYIFCPAIFLFDGNILNLAETTMLLNETAHSNRDYLLVMDLKDIILKTLILITIVGIILIVGLGSMRKKRKRQDI
ncbi:MAG: hypothetical protein Q7U47_15650 [Paludibacter sp.]|nr:hypothetical protein [Paludibacter sp.]